MFQKYSLKSKGDWHEVVRRSDGAILLKTKRLWKAARFAMWLNNTDAVMKRKERSKANGG